jgi:hypothetical protein
MEAATTQVQGGGSPPTTGRATGDGRQGLPLLAAAGVAVAVALGAINSRMDGEWGTGIFFVLNGIAAAALLVVAISALRATAGPGAGAGGGSPGASGRGAADDRARPSGDITALLVAGYFLLALTIGNFADILGAEGGSGSTMWTTLLFGAIVAYPAWVLRSPISALFSALALGIAFLAFVDWVFDYESFDTLRWLILILILAYAGASAIARDTSYRHEVQMVNAAGVATLALAVSVFVAAVAAQFGELFAPFGTEADTGGPVGWELLTLLAAAGLVWYAATRREPGPGYLGGIALFLFAVSAAIPDEDGASLVGWPIVLFLLAAALVAAAVMTGAASLPGGGPRGGAGPAPGAGSAAGDGPGVPR